MAAPSNSRIKILNILLALETPEFTLKQVRDALPGMEKQTIFYHLKEMVKEGILSREGRGAYRYKTRQQLVDDLTDQLDRNPSTRGVIPTHFIKKELANDLNELAKNTRAMKKAGIPLGSIYDAQFRDWAKQAIKEFQQFINLLSINTMSMHDATTHMHDKMDWDYTEESMKRHYPDTWEAHWDHFRKVANRGRQS